MINKYFVISDRADELEVVKALKPEHLLINYLQFKNKSVLGFIDKLGYTPRVLIDPGSYGAFKQGKEIDLYSYINFVYKSLPYLNGYDFNPFKNPFPLVVEYLSLDIIGDLEKTFDIYEFMRECNYDFAVPVFHYGSPIYFLEKYISLGAKRIALGGTLKVKNELDIVRWVRSIVYKYHDVYFHLLGNTNPSVLNSCKKLDSCDSSTWILNAGFGNPRHIKGTGREVKIRRAYYNMHKEKNRLYI